LVLRAKGSYFVAFGVQAVQHKRDAPVDPERAERVDR
jgi:hypothetical protein